MRQLVYRFLFFLVTQPAFSQPNPTTVQADYKALLNAERSFAQTALNKGIKDAFVANLDDQSVVYVSDRFTPGKMTYQQAPTIPGMLTWRPTYAEISACGTLGFTTGPFEFRPRTIADEPVSYGQFTSVWHKTATDDWKVLIDLGCTHPKPAEETDTIQVPTSPFVLKTTAQLDTATLSYELMQTERSFAETARVKSLRDAYDPVMSTTNSVRLLREGCPASEGKLAKELASTSSEKVDFQPLRVVVSKAGDLGYCYGYMTFKQSRSGYLRIWRRNNTRWQLVQEVLTTKLT